MRIRYLACAAVFGIVSVGSTASPASADPKNGEQVLVDCVGIGEVAVTSTMGRGAWPPGLASYSNRVFVAYAAHVVVTITDADGTRQEVFDVSKNAPHNGRTTVCTMHSVDTHDEGTVTLDVTYWVHYTPGH